MPDPSLIAPLVEHPAGELGAVVRDQHVGLPSLMDDPVENTGHPKPRKAGIHLNGQAFPSEGIDYIQCPQRPAIRQGIRSEVHGPLFARSGWRLQVFPWASLESLPNALSHG